MANPNPGHRRKWRLPFAVIVAVALLISAPVQAGDGKIPRADQLFFTAWKRRFPLGLGSTRSFILMMAVPTREDVHGAESALVFTLDELAKRGLLPVVIQVAAGV